MKERPIIFHSNLIPAIFTGDLKQTRRVIKFPKGAYIPDTDWIASVNPDGRGGWVAWGPHPVSDEDSIQLYQHDTRPSWTCPFGRPGDRLWVRETLRRTIGNELTVYDTDNHVVEGPDGHWAPWTWKHKRLPAIYMPKWACRIKLEILNVRAEKLTSISREDAIAEGIEAESVELGMIVTSQDKLVIGDDVQLATSKEVFNFALVWNQINAKRGFPWVSNPWVWVIEVNRFWYKSGGG